MLNFDNVSLRRGGRLLVSGLSAQIHPGHKVGITGANGTGKSSLLALVRGELEADAGRFDAPAGWRMASVAQEVPASDRAAIDFVLDGDAELRAAEAALAAAERDGDGRRQAALHADIEAMDGYSARARAARLMSGLGFAPEQESAPVRSFSGGWRVRLALAQALMRRCELLLLDEPTNHLDLDAVLWLAEWLKSYSGTLLLISHDRDFLDDVSDHILHIEHARATLYNGNYSAFEAKRAERMAQQQAAFEKQQREVAHMHAFIDRFRAKATKARAAQSRLKVLERMEQVAAAHVDSPFTFRFLDPLKAPRPLLTLDGAAAGYGADTVLSGVKASIRPGERIALLGPNGAGKSTLIKLLAGHIAPLDGERFTAPDTAVGYFAQHQLEQLDAHATPLQHLLRLDPGAREQALRDFLGGFGFGEAALQPVGPFSGGEKARLALAMVVYRRPNLLLLDEPTNHLDLEMRHALSVALQDYAGAMVIVSHDRHLLRAVADQYWLVVDGAVSAYQGDLDDYARWLSQRRRQPGAPAPSAPGVDRRGQRRLEARKRQALQPLRAECRRLEKALDRVHRRRQALEHELADPALYEEDAKESLKGLLIDKARLDHELQSIEEAWLAAGEKLEAAERGA